MFYYISGTLAHKSMGFAVIDAGGVGYRMTVSQNTYDKLPLTGNPAKLYNYLAVREDGIELFGFYDETELSSFQMLITVSGVGPKAAMSILSLLTPEKFALAVCTEDTKAISKASGIGPKTAARIVLELKDKLIKEHGGEFTAAPDLGSGAKSGGTPARGKLSEALDALMVLGYQRAEATNVLKSLPTEQMTLEEIIRQALKKLM
ncbi:MAG: Holliday junction branch migration protein RuvA [Clostridia bacterium]|nr:Holliday junction branch migration protein RuvA [Clostridia bacterium]